MAHPLASSNSRYIPECAEFHRDAQKGRIGYEPNRSILHGYKHTNIDLSRNFLNDHRRLRVVLATIHAWR